MADDWAVVRRPAALDDLIDIWAYVAEYDMASADRLIDRMELAMARLAQFPRLGSVREAFGKGVRAWLVDRYLVAYLLDDDECLVEIIRIIDARRDLKNLGLEP